MPFATVRGTFTIGLMRAFWINKGGNTPSKSNPYVQSLALPIALMIPPANPVFDDAMNHAVTPSLIPLTAGSQSMAEPRIDLASTLDEVLYEIPER